MKKSKIILLFVLSFGLVALISVLLGAGVSAAFSLPFAPIVGAFMAAIFVGNYALQYYRDVIVIRKELKKLNEKPYKKYEIESLCQSCGNKQIVEIDLDDLEYTCEKCKKPNAIYVRFMTAAITEPSSVVIP